jgi:glutathione synthase
MKTLFIVDKLEVKYFEFNKLVTDFWIIKEMLERNEEIFVATMADLSLKNSVAYCKCLQAYEKNSDIFLEKEPENRKIEDFKLVMFRPDPPVDMKYITATYIFDFVDKRKTFVMNNPAAIRNFNEKLHTNYFLEFMPKNIVTASKAEIKEFLKENDEIILKPLNQCFGGGVMHLKLGDMNTNSIITTMTSDQTTPVMVQKYIPLAVHGDKRVLFLGDEVLEECVIKLPTKDDFKFNTHNLEMDYVKKATLSDSELLKFKEVAKKLNSMGLYTVGLDVIDEKIIETNVTSPCYFINEINTYFSTKLEKQIVDYILATCEKYYQNVNPLDSKCLRK